MQAQVQRFNPRSFIGIAAVAGGLGILAHFGGQMWATQPATIAPPQVAVPIQVVPAEQPVALTLDALLSEAAALAGMPAMGDATEAGIEARWGAQTYTNGSAECVYSILDKLGLTNCEASTDRFMETCRQFYSIDHCANRMEPGAEQVGRRQHQPVGVASADVGGNYVPEHWPSEIRAALQYPAGYNHQRWAQENLP
jgi:hypothetical protein